MPRLRFDSSHSPTWARTFAAGGIDIELRLAVESADDDDAHGAARGLLDALEERSKSARYAGFFAYDLGRCFERLPAPPPTGLYLPMAAFLKCGASRDPCPAPSDAGPRASAARSNFTKAAYLAAVRRCIEYVAAGDVFQINLAQQLRIDTPLSPAEIYARLRTATPGHYDALLDFGDYAIISNSPELFFKVERLPDGRRRIVNRPIKGTRPAAAGMEAELVASAKDRAELAMIVDLQRNDLGRICRTGTVRVLSAREIETHATVVHGVATVEGILRDDVTLLDVLRAAFPCGSVTGCPKIRAMQIIDALEPTRRGVYCGAIGWIENGEMEFSVAIRTMTLAAGVAHVPVGGGIVADSDPESEYAETLVKARALLSALGVGSETGSLPSGRA
ncbi:MAG TPA: anthranilate synthase component I family protein [Tepidisphaeraceae bacterium]|jgi:para-aminobenzoate synthetase component 1